MRSLFFERSMIWDKRTNASYVSIVKASGQALMKYGWIEKRV